MDDLRNLGGDLCQLQYRFPIELSSELQDIVPLPGRVLQRLRMSNDAINFGT